jgi:ubiquinone biosynthesis protein
MSDASTDTPETNGTAVAPWGKTPWRVRIARLVVATAIVILVFGIVPGLSTSRNLAFVDIILLAAAFGLLEILLRPVINALFIRYTVQTYGAILVGVDVVLFGLLILLFDFDLDVAGLLPVLIGGVLLGVLRVAAEAVLGLTRPVVPERSGRRGGTGDTGLLRFSANARENLRLARIYQTLSDHAIDALMSGHGTLSAIRRRIQTFLWSPPVPLRAISPPERFRLLLQDLGPTYVKIGQLISSQARSLPPEWLDELEKLQSDVRPYPYEQVRERIVAELGAPPEELYASFSTTALAAASLGQVHRATLHDGTEVAVKVQRPGIHSQLKSDVRILAKMSDTLERRFRWAVDYDLTGIIVEFGTTLLRELDYDVEAYNNRRLGRVLEPINGVRVPDVYYDLSSTGVLTLEFVRGVKSTDAPAIAAAGLNPQVLAENMVRGAVKMLMIDGFFHADPHPGNVFVDLDSGEMTLLDTGMVGELSFQNRVKLGSLILTIRNGDIAGLAQTLKSLSVPFRETNDERYYKDFERKLTPYLDPPPGHKVQVAEKVMPAAMDVLTKNGYRFDPQLTLAMKSFAQAEAITKALVPQWTGTEFMERAVDALQVQAVEAVTPEAVKEVATRQASYLVRDAVEQMPSLRQGILKWLGLIKRGAIKVEVDTSDLDKQVEALRSIARMITLGILIVGLVIGSAIASGTAQLAEGPLDPVTEVAATIFVVSAVAGSLWVIVAGWSLWRESRQRKQRPLDRF